MESKKVHHNWFASWFDSPYYHILYSNRDEDEASDFVDEISEYLNLKDGSKILDIACGKGRHSRHLNRLGYNVTGTDLSEENIKYCREYENDSLHFFKHDMRRLFRINYFDAAVNLFTSFGYFEHNRDDKMAIKAAAKGLKKNGKFVIDFMNVSKIALNLVPQNKSTIEGIEFTINRSAGNNFITKNIQFSDNGHDYNFDEKVKMLTLNDFKELFNHASLKIVDIFGNYQLDAFDEKTSDRLILVASK
ncbi:MAG: methyltransferase domain-containing protein [Bacteroidia bacterium]|nr:methyltransferase domain-containing protein [Bacteroidia bacterium]NNC86640.1 methyltransferase domain-containing protein [Bacteroidia bacterium]NNM16233.1 methyltransferase domain-containing protein [Bacteroidia bacterium]